MEIKEFLEQLPVELRVPFHPHDCEYCVFLGGWIHKNIRYDLYFCGGNHPTVIARYGEEYMYFSGMFFVHTVAELKEPYIRAKKVGL